MASLLNTSWVRITTVKHAVGNPSYQWVNTYEALILVPTQSASTWGAALSEISTAEALLHHNAVAYDKVIASTFAPEQPYEPDSLYVREVSNVGSRAISGDPLARNICLHVKRTANFGKSGKLFYRGCLGEADMISSNALDLQLTSGAATAINTLLSSFFTAINSAFVALGGTGSRLVMYGPPAEQTGAPTTERTVTGLVARGVSVNAPDHRYFDRA